MIVRMVRIETPGWTERPAPAVDGLSDAEYAYVKQHRAEMLAIVQSEVESYVNDAELCFDGMEFPDRTRLARTYYIGRESYWAHRSPDWFQISVECRCLERPTPWLDREDDYLGLEVWLRLVPGRWAKYEVFRNTDSSSI